MDFLKKHYEKILLALVLLGLMGAVVFMVMYVPHHQEEMKAYENKVLNPQITPLAKWKPELFDMGAENAALQRAQTALKLDFTTGHNLFNPVLWQLLPSGKLRKIQTGNEIGPGALQILAINPIHLVVSNSPAVNDAYPLTVFREVPGVSRPVEERHALISRDHTNEIFTLKDITGPADNPTLSLEFRSTHEPFTVSADKPFRRVDGYTVDLKYPPDNKTWFNLRPGQGRYQTTLTFENATYILVEVKENYVVVLSEANNKKTTIYFNPTNTESH